MELPLQSQRMGAIRLHGRRRRRDLRERRLLPGAPPFGKMAFARAESEAARRAGDGRRAARVRVCTLPRADGSGRRRRDVAEEGPGRNERPFRLRRRDVGRAAALVLRVERLGHAHETAHGVDVRRPAQRHPRPAGNDRRAGDGRESRAHDQAVFHRQLKGGTRLRAHGRLSFLLRRRDCVFVRRVAGGHGQVACERHARNRPVAASARRTCRRVCHPLGARFRRPRRPARRPPTQIPTRSELVVYCATCCCNRSKP